MGLNLKIPPNWGSSNFQIIYYRPFANDYIFYRSATVPTINFLNGEYLMYPTSTAYWHSWDTTTQTWGSQNTASTSGNFPFDKTTLAEVDEIIVWTSHELYYSGNLVSAVKVYPLDVFALSETWIITDNINDSYPHLSNVPLPTDTVLTEPYPRWAWRIDQFYNGGYPYLIGLRPTYVIPDGKFVNGQGVKIIWEQLLNVLGVDGESVPFAIPNNKYLDGHGLAVLTAQAKMLIGVETTPVAFTIPDNGYLDGHGLAIWWRNIKILIK